MGRGKRRQLPGKFPDPLDGGGWGGGVAPWRIVLSLGFLGCLRWLRSALFTHSPFFHFNDRPITSLYYGGLP